MRDKLKAPGPGVTPDPGLRLARKPVYDQQQREQQGECQDGVGHLPYLLSPTPVSAGAGDREAQRHGASAFPSLGGWS